MNTKHTHEASQLVSAAFALQDMMTSHEVSYLRIDATDAPRHIVGASLPDTVAREIIGAALGIVYARIERLGGRGLLDQLSERAADLEAT